MSHWNHVGHMLRHLREGEREAEGDTDKSRQVAVGYIVLGFFLAPMLIGIPMMLYGLYKLAK